MLTIIYSFGAFKLEASEVTKPIKPSERVSNHRIPKIFQSTSKECVHAGSRFIVKGKNLNQLNSAIGLHRLVLLNQGKQESIEYKIKNDKELSVIIPATLKNIFSVGIGVLTKEERSGSSIDVKLCSGDKEPRKEPPPDRPMPDPDRPKPDQPEPSRPEPDQPKPDSPGPDKPDPDRPEADKPEPDKPDPHKPDPDTSNLDVTASPTTNNALKRRLANRKTGGSLLGAALPPIPPELRLKKTKDDSTFVNNELVAASSDIDQAKQLATIMSSYKARVLRRKTLKSLGIVLTTFRLSPGSTVVEILEKVKNDQPELWVDANHFYYSSTASVSGSKTKMKVAKSTKKIIKKKNNRRTKLFTSIGHGNSKACHQKIKIGILDGPVDTKVESLVNQSITQKQMFSRGKKAASTTHATAIASLLVGGSGFPDLKGVINHAELVVGVVMQAKKSDPKKIFTTTENLIVGLNWLVEKQVQVINLSLGGPRNALLEVAINKVIGLDIGVVAAAGNGGGNAEISYPAAQAGVIAVSALDSESKLAKDATQGDYIELSAPGVDLWVASKQSEAHYLSGSSLASPLVSAALAQLGGSPTKALTLFEISKDLGPAGKDPKFGWGMLQFPECH